jgi:hypothetical protein
VSASPATNRFADVARHAGLPLLLAVGVGLFGAALVVVVSAGVEAVNRRIVEEPRRLPQRRALSPIASPTWSPPTPANPDDRYSRLLTTQTWLATLFGLIGGAAGFVESQKRLHAEYRHTARKELLQLEARHVSLSRLLNEILSHRPPRGHAVAKAEFKSEADLLRNFLRMDVKATPERDAPAQALLSAIAAASNQIDALEPGDVRPEFEDTMNQAFESLRATYR